MQKSEADAYFELSFSPNARLVSTVRRFVAAFYVQILADAEVTDRLAVATHELLENAVRYSSDGNTRVRIGVKREPGGCAVTIDTINRAAAGDLAGARTTLDEIASAQDPQRHYQVLMRRSITRTDGSGLGLGRVRAESGMSLSYEIDGDMIHVRARALFESGVEA